MSEWIETELKNLTVKIGSGATPRGGQEAYKTEGISLIRSQNILDFSFSTNGLAFIDDEQARQLQNVEIQEKDVLINITGDSVARVCMVPAETLPARVNQHVAILRADSKKLDPDYLLYYLLNPVIKRHLLRLSSDGATRNALTKSNLEELIISAPKDIIKQREIAEKIKLLDSKISLLRKQNETLEELAQTLFEHLVLEESIEKVVTLDEVAKIGIGRTPPRKEDHWFSKSSSDIKWISIKDLGLCDVFINNTSEYLTKEAVTKFSIPIIPKNTVVLSFKMTLGRVAITTEEMLSNEAIAHFKIKDESIISTEYLYFFLKTYKYQNLGSTSSIVTSINSGMIKNIEITIPKKVRMTKFSKSVMPIFEAMNSNSMQIESLIQLRDTLLPKLMSGELMLK